MPNSLLRDGVIPQPVLAALALAARAPAAPEPRRPARDWSVLAAPRGGTARSRVAAAQLRRLHYKRKRLPQS
jgi:hypothetical protein